ncbi:MAG: type II toxin-antitoxin system VapB family antitoxin [Xanthomonadales bacterium]|nr:type II toxin-antitoxin system VapB family antitoxin [Xanthomonadales bacterium]
MALNIRNDEAQRLAAEVARMTGETKTQAVITALHERLQRVRRARARSSRAGALLAIAEECARLPVLDPRGNDEILGYDDDDGVPR